MILQTFEITHHNCFHLNHRCSLSPRYRRVPSQCNYCLRKLGSHLDTEARQWPTRVSPSSLYSWFYNFWLNPSSHKSAYQYRNINQLGNGLLEVPANTPRISVTISKCTEVYPKRDLKYKRIHHQVEYFYQVDIYKLYFMIYNFNRRCNQYLQYLLRKTFLTQWSSITLIVEKKRLLNGKVYDAKTTYSIYVTYGRCTLNNITTVVSFASY